MMDNNRVAVIAGATSGLGRLVAKQFARLPLREAIDERQDSDLNPSPNNAGWTSPEEIVPAILFLCSQEATLLNGALIPLYAHP
jgi:NAD(P)-dependent dehydrogenase (short-subunit alcohol dehydrogenase family)